MGTDASGHGYGGVLRQRVTDGSWRPVSFTSCKLTAPDVKYTVTGPESLAIVHCLRKWRCYLHGEQKLVVKMDYLLLKWLMSLKDPRRRLEKLMGEAQDFEFVLKYAHGASMMVSSALSRNAVTQPLCQPCFLEIGALEGHEEVSREV